MTDINEQVREDWKAETTGFERVRAILEETREPASAGEIAERALVSEPTARKHLDTLVDVGLATTVEDGRTTRYARDEEHLLMERVRELRAEHDREELLDGIRRMKDQLREYEDTHEASSPEELAIRLDGTDEGEWNDVSAWRTTRQNLALAQTALSYAEAYDIATA